MAFAADADRTTVYTFGAAETLVTCTHEYDAAGGGHRLKVLPTGGSLTTGTAAPLNRIAKAGNYRAVSGSYMKSQALSGTLSEVFLHTGGTLDD